MPTNIPSTDPKLKEILVGISAWNSNIRIMQQATSVNAHDNKFLPKLNQNCTKIKPVMEDIGEDMDEDYIPKKEDGYIFRANEFILPNGVADFAGDLNSEEDKGDSNYEENIQKKCHYSEILPCHVPSKYQFEEDVSGDEDAVLNYASNKSHVPAPNCDVLNRVASLASQNETDDIVSACRDTSETRKYRTPSSSTPSKKSNTSMINTPLRNTPTYLTLSPSTPKNSNTSSETNLAQSSQDDILNDSETTSNVNSDSNSTSFLSDSSVHSLHSISRKKPRKYEKVKLNEALMANSPVKIVDEIPWDINGNVIYKVKCKESDYIDTYQDGRWFSLNNSSNNRLNGFRKTGKCLGSLICARATCTKITSEGVVNTIDFKREGEGVFSCGSCGYPVKRTYCGAIKRVEYNKDTGYLTYWHQGPHICTLKLNVRKRRKAIDRMPLPLTGSSKPQEYMKACMLHYVDEDNYDDAFEIPEALSEQDVIAHIKSKRKYPNATIHKADELYAFNNVNQIQQSLLKSDKDRYLVYKWECVSMGHKASYVFKTSAVSLRIALMMSGKIKVGSEDSILAYEPAYFDGMHSRVKYFVSLTLWAFHPAM